MDPIPAATVVLVRPGVEVFLLRRHKKSSFMSDAFVFPGGKVDPEDGGAEIAAIRELFEEAGVLLVEETVDPARAEVWRRQVNAGERTFAELLGTEGLTPAPGRLHPWARWVTPSIEPKRFDARFFVAELPAGQTPHFDDKETVDELWISAPDALARQAAGTLKLPPPQVRTFAELAPYGDISALVAAAAERAPHIHPVCPRFAQIGETVALLLPWDPAYAGAAGDGWPMPPDHPMALAGGGSRFILEGMTWRLSSAASPP